MNSKVNNLVVELEQFKLHLDWIPGSRNLLADSLHCLLDVDADANQTDEPHGHEFRSYCFEDLQPAKVLEIVNTEMIELNEGHGEDREHSLNSRKVWEMSVEAMEMPRPQRQQQSQGGSSDFEEDSQNLRILTEERMFKLNYSKKPLINRKLQKASESSESSQNSRKNACIEGVIYAGPCTANV